MVSNLEKCSETGVLLFFNKFVCWFLELFGAFFRGSKGPGFVGGAGLWQ